MSKTKLLIILAIIMTFSYSSTKDDSTEKDLINIDVTTTIKSTPIELSWKPVESCSWHKKSCDKTDGTSRVLSTFQDRVNNPITLTSSDLTTDTDYEITMNSTDYANGGKVLATKTWTIKTNL